MNGTIFKKTGLNLILTAAAVLIWVCPGAAGELDRSFAFKVNLCILPIIKALDPGKMSISYNGRGRDLPVAQSHPASLRNTDLGILLENPISGEGFAGVDQPFGKMVDFFLRYIQPGSQDFSEETRWSNTPSRPMVRDMVLEFETKGSEVSGAILFTMPI